MHDGACRYSLLFIIVYTHISMHAFLYVHVGVIHIFFLWSIVPRCSRFTCHPFSVPGLTKLTSTLDTIPGGYYSVSKQPVLHYIPLRGIYIYYILYIYIRNYTYIHTVPPCTMDITGTCHEGCHASTCTSATLELSTKPRLGSRRLQGPREVPRNDG